MIIISIISHRHKKVKKGNGTAIGLYGLVALFVNLCHLFDHLDFFLVGKEIGYLAGIKQIADIFQERLVFDLKILITLENESEKIRGRREEEELKGNPIPVPCSVVQKNN